MQDSELQRYYAKAGDDYLTCSLCKGTIHKQNKCSNLSRERVKLIDEKTWTCKNCIRQASSFPETEDTTTQNDPDQTTITSAPQKKQKVKCKCCRQPIKDIHLVCLSCKGKYHLQIKCAGITYKQIVNLEGDNWTCPGCKEEQNK